MPTEPVQSTVKRAQAMLEQTKTQGTKAFAGSSFDKAISTSDLTPVPQFKVSPPPMTSPIETALSDIQGMTTPPDTFTQGLTEKRKEAEKPLSTSRQTLLDELKAMRGQSSLTSEAYGQDGGVDTIEQELNAINNQILTEQNNLRRRLETIDKNTGGGLASGVQAEKERIQRDSLRKQADLSVIQMGIQGRFDSAKAIADRAVSAYLEAQQQRMDILKFDYEENKDLFTTAEQREFDVMIADRTRKFQQEADTQKTIQDLAIEAQRNGAPSSVASQMLESGSVSSAMDIGGGYIGLIERRKANAAMANAELERRLALLKLAEAGDIKAMVELGIDPNAPDAQEKAKTQEQLTKLDQEIARVDQMLTNTDGLAASAGVFRSPALSSYGKNLGITVPTGAATGSIIPGIGTLVGTAGGLLTGLVTGSFEYAQTRDQKADFLNKANYVAENLTIEKIKQMKADGVSFNPLTDKDAERIGKATSELSGSNAIRNEKNEIVGFTSEKIARESLQQVKQILEEAKAREYKKLITSGEYAEIEKE